MNCTEKGNKKINPHYKSHCLIEVVTKAGLTVVLIFYKINDHLLFINVHTI